MYYIAQETLYTGAMLVVYLLFLRNRPYFQLSRYYLLLASVAPLIIPFLRIPSPVQQQLQKLPLIQYYLPDITVSAISGKFSWEAVPYLAICYIAVSCLIMTWYAWNGYKLWQIISRNSRQDHGSYSLVTATGAGPGSFGKYIFFPGDDVNDTILAHERAHIMLHHTRDLIFLYALQAIVWPNVLMAWIIREMKEIHEFQADAQVSASKEEYTQLLLCSVFSTDNFPLMHSFIIHPIKRRIMMLQKNGKASPLKAFVLVSISAGMLITGAASIQSCDKPLQKTTSGPQPSDADKAEMVKLIQNEQGKAGSGTPSLQSAEVRGDADKPDSNGVYRMADVMPTTEVPVSKFLADNLKYPAEARNKKIEGRVIVRFVVDEKGEVKSPVVLKSPNDLLTAEALRVIGLMPRWTPGMVKSKPVSVYFVLPIVFRLS